MARNFMCTKTDPVVETKAGKLRGFQLDGTYVFHGVKYADAKRFHQPTPVEPWEGIKNALAYGYVCPMLQQDQPSNELMVPHRYWPLDENCQYLNIWTQHLDPNAKKPVLVWLHGGGFAAGFSANNSKSHTARMPHPPCRKCFKLWHKRYKNVSFAPSV